MATAAGPAGGTPRGAAAPAACRDLCWALFPAPWLTQLDPNRRRREKSDHDAPWGASLGLHPLRKRCAGPAPAGGWGRRLETAPEPPAGAPRVPAGAGAHDAECAPVLHKLALPAQPPHRSCPPPPLALPQPSTLGICPTPRPINTTPCPSLRSSTRRTCAAPSSSASADRQARVPGFTPSRAQQVQQERRAAREGPAGGGGQQGQTGSGAAGSGQSGRVKQGSGSGSAGQ